MGEAERVAEIPHLVIRVALPAHDPERVISKRDELLGLLQAAGYRVATI